MTIIGFQTKPFIDFLVQLADVISHFEESPIYQASKERILEEAILPNVVKTYNVLTNRYKNSTIQLD